MRVFSDRTTVDRSTGSTSSCHIVHSWSWTGGGGCTHLYRSIHGGLQQRLGEAVWPRVVHRGQQQLAHQQQLRRRVVLPRWTRRRHEAFQNERIQPHRFQTTLAPLACRQSAQREEQQTEAVPGQVTGCNAVVTAHVVRLPHRAQQTTHHGKKLGQQFAGVRALIEKVNRGRGREKDN